MRDVKVSGGKECVSQHKLLVGDFELSTSFSKSCCASPKRKLWKFSNPEVRLEYENCVHESAQFFKTHRILTVPGLKSKTVCLMHVILCVVGHSGKPKRKETWWWNDEVDPTIKTKRQLWNK